MCFDESTYSSNESVYLPISEEREIIYKINYWIDINILVTLSGIDAHMNNCNELLTFSDLKSTGYILRIVAKYLIT